MFNTAGCSICEVMILLALFLIFIHEEKIAILSLSVPPEVNIISPSSEKYLPISFLAFSSSL